MTCTICNLFSTLGLFNQTVAIFRLSFLAPNPNFAVLQRKMVTWKRKSANMMITVQSAMKTMIRTCCCVMAAQKLFIYLVLVWQECLKGTGTAQCAAMKL